MADELPNGIPKILSFLADYAAGYGNHLKWNEVARLKADLMHQPRRWTGVPVVDIATRCRQLGMREEDVTTISDLVSRAQAGGRLVPQRTYRDFSFEPRGFER